MNSIRALFFGCAGGCNMAFRTAVVQQTTAVQVGYMPKPQSVVTVTHKDGLYIHVASSLDWVCRALTKKGHSTDPLKGNTHLIERCLRHTFGGEEDTSALAEEVDPMEELHSEDDCAGGRREELDEVLETPKNDRGSI